MTLKTFVTFTAQNVHILASHILSCSILPLCVFPIPIRTSSLLELLPHWAVFHVGPQHLLQHRFYFFMSDSCLCAALGEEEGKAEKSLALLSCVRSVEGRFWVLWWSRVSEESTTDPH